MNIPPQHESIVWHDPAAMTVTYETALAWVLQERKIERLRSAEYLEDWGDTFREAALVLRKSRPGANQIEVSD